MPSSGTWTGIAEGLEEALGRRVDRRDAERERQRLEEERRAQQQQNLLVELSYELAKQGVNPSGISDPTQAMDLLASAVGERRQQEQGGAEADRLMALLEDNPRMAAILTRQLKRQGRDLGSLADFSDTDLALLPALSSTGRQEIRRERRERRQEATEAATEEERTRLELQKLQAEIGATVALAKKRGVETFLAQTADRSGLGPEEVGRLYLRQVNELHQQKAALEKALANQFLMPGQQEAIEDQLRHLSGEGVIAELAKSQTLEAVNAARSLGDSSAQPSSDPNDREALRQQVQELRENGYSKAEALRLATGPGGFDPAVAQEVVDDEYGAGPRR